MMVFSRKKDATVGSQQFIFPEAREMSISIKFNPYGMCFSRTKKKKSTQCLLKMTKNTLFEIIAIGESNLTQLHRKKRQDVLWEKYWKILEGWLK